MTRIILFKKSMSESSLEKLKGEIIAILKKKEQDSEVKKAIEHFEQDEIHYTHLEKSLTGKWIEKAGYGVGTIRVWKGKKYKKVAPNKWVRMYDKEDRGAKSSMTRLINKVKACKTEEELYQFCMSNHALFKDANGIDLPIMDKLRAAIDEHKGKLESGSNNKAEKKDPEGKFNQGDKARDKRIGGVALWDGKVKNAIKSGDAAKIKETISAIEKEYDSIKDGLKGDEKDFAESELKFRKRDADNALKELGNKESESEDKKETDIEDELYEIRQEGEKLAKKENLTKEDKDRLLDLSKKQQDLLKQQKELVDAKRKESESEKHQNRSDAMKGNQNARKYGAIEVSDKDMKLVTGVMQMDNETIDSTIASYEKEIKERPNGYNVEDYKKRLAIYKNEKEQRKNPLKDIKNDDEIPGIYDKNGLNTISKIANALNMSTDEVRQKVTNRWSNSDWGNDPMKRYLDINDANGKGYAGIPDFSQPLYDNAVTDVVEDYLRDKLSNYIGNGVSDGYVRDCAYDVVNGQMNLKKAEDEIKGKSTSSTNTSSNPYVHKKIGAAIEKYATDKKIKSTVDKISHEDFSRDPSALGGNPAMNGVFHEDGYKIATDGKILSMIKSDYSSEDEGKIKATPKAIKRIDKTISNLRKILAEREQTFELAKKKGVGSLDYRSAAERVAVAKGELENAEKSKETGVINGKFPSYKKVIPSFGNAKLETPEGFNDFDNILRVTKVANAYKKANDDKSTAVKVGNKWFDPENLEKVVAMAKKHGLNEVLYDPERENSPVEFKGANGSIVIMPNANGTYNTFDVATGNYSSLNDDTQKKMDDFINSVDDKKSDIKKALFDLIDMLDESEDKETDFEDNDASQPELFNNPEENVANALNELFGC